MNHELKASAQQVICQGCWQYQLACTGCQGYRQVRGLTSHNHNSPFYIEGWKHSQASSCGVHPPEQQHNWSKKKKKPQQKERKEQIAHAVIHVQHITAGPEFKVGRGWNSRITEARRSKVCACVFILAGKGILWTNDESVEMITNGSWTLLADRRWVCLCVSPAWLPVNMSSVCDTAGKTAWPQRSSLLK